MEVSSSLSETQFKEPQEEEPGLEGHRLTQDRAFYTIYAVALAASISLWFLAIRAPLWLDETVSYWQISAGFLKIWPRQFLSLSFPAYSYILWFSTKLIGTSEIALRVPSILAMLGAVYLLYLAARELFNRDIAYIAVIVFCLHRFVAFAAIDVRPYAFAVLATNASILIVLRLRRNDSNWLAALLGVTAALIVWFHYLFATILPALVLCFFVIKTGERKVLWRQFGIALATFALAILPVIPGLHFLFRTAGTYVYEAAPRLSEFFDTFPPGLTGAYIGIIVFIMAVVTAVRSRFNKEYYYPGWIILLCASLALIPVLILFSVSAGTSIHAFTGRHRLEAIPGIALCWAMLYGVLRPRVLRLLMCVVLVVATAFQSYSTPALWHHAETWKYALEAAEKSAATDNAPVLMCSAFVETNYATNPVYSAKDNPYYAPLSYYRLSVPVVPLPMELNSDAIRIGTQFLQEATNKRERFLVLAETRSYGTLEWLSQHAAGSYSVHKLGVYDRIEVLEFVPQARLSSTP
jgi:uncharacterized membrane protein